MNKLLIFICCMTLLSSCSDFLEEYSQDLSKVENYTDLDEVLLGDGYLAVGRVWQSSAYSVGVENAFFQTIHYMSDELSVFLWDTDGDYDLGIQEKMFGYHCWQRDVGLRYGGTSRAAEDGDWNEAYHRINTCNMVLNLVDEQASETEEQELEKTRIKGEAAFLRGLYYFHLVNLYGKPYCEANLSSPGVPLKLSPLVEDKVYTMNTVEEVYQQVLEDLDLAEACLKNTPIKNHPYRADYTSVLLLKSRVYLYMQDWEKALDYAQKVLERNASLLDLNTFSANSGDVLTKSSPETIFSMGGHTLCSSIYNKKEVETGGEYTALPVYIISDDLLSAFDEGENDWRMRYYIMQDVVGGGYFFEGYMNAWVLNKVCGWEDINYKEVSDNFLFRTAEAYLNGAEAAAMSGDESTARSLLKTLRDKRLKISRELTESGEALVSFIRTERQRELCLEGHRWFDLRRYSVCEKFPYSKTITHQYCYLDLWTYMIYRENYVLEENDEAYTLALPLEVRDFQNTLGVNNRPDRPGTTGTFDEPEQVDPPGTEVSAAYQDGYEDGYQAGLADYESGLFYEGEYNTAYDASAWESVDDLNDYDDGFYAGYEDGLNGY